MHSYLEILEPILREAGEMILAYRAKHGLVHEKEQNEIVTKADIACNELLVSSLTKFFPQIEIYSEEDPSHRSQHDERWIIDPIDGTTPFVWGNSGFSISVALEQKGVVVFGVVYDPVMHEIFYAQKAKGAYRDGKIIQVNTEKETTKMLLVVDWGNSDDKRAEGLQYYQRFMLPKMFSRRVVPQFAPALGLCHLAEGRIHALICNDTWVEDHSAAALILAEAGGTVSNFYDTQQFNHRRAGIIAANTTQTHEKIVRFLHSFSDSIS